MIVNTLVAGFGNYRKKARNGGNKPPLIKNYDEWMKRTTVLSFLWLDFRLYNKLLI
jgi:hypothetical protein